MRDKRCEPVRRELEELMLNDDFSTAIAEHLQTCSSCRDFQRQQTKLRQIVGSLGTINAPADFDFRLRARLAADSQAPSFRFWTFTVKGLATAAVLVVFGVGSVVVWQRMQHQEPAVAVTPPRVEEPARSEVSHYGSANNDLAGVLNPAVAEHRTEAPSRKNERAPVVHRAKRPVSTIDFSSERANVVSNTRPAINTTVFPIEASLQSVKVSLDDGRGNERTISLPTISFGSQRVPTISNQFANKSGAW